MQKIVHLFGATFMLAAAILGFVAIVTAREAVLSSPIFWLAILTGFLGLLAGLPKLDHSEGSHLEAPADLGVKVGAAIVDQPVAHDRARNRGVSA